MTVTTRVAAPRRTPMTATRKAALVAGILYLITFVASIPALGLYERPPSASIVRGGGARRLPTGSRAGAASRVDG